MTNSPSRTRHLGIVAATALVVGNMVGSGIFLLPSSLAPYGAYSLMGWLVSLSGILALAWVFADFARQLPKSGGPYAYTREVFGDFAGYMVAWGYWVSIWCANAAIAVALISYLSYFVPALQDSPAMAGLTAGALIWIVTWINLRGIREAARVQIVTTLLKLTPLVLFAIIGLIRMDWLHLEPTVPAGETPLSSILAVSALTLWAFLGVESATIPADEVRDPRRIIPRATLIGAILTGVIYFLSSAAVQGIVPAAELAESTAPFAVAGSMILGSWAPVFISLGAILSCFGALNGWVLLQGQMPAVTARDGLLPKWFAGENARGVPANSLVFGSVIVSLLMLANYTRGMAAFFEFAILLSTLAVLLPYLLVTLARLKGKSGLLPRLRFWQLGLVLYALAFSIWATIGTGVESILWGLALLAAGIPIYLWMRSRRPNPKS